MVFNSDPSAILETGLYQFVITKYEEKQPAEEGKYPFAIVGVNVVAPADFEGLTHEELYSFSRKAQYRFKDLIIACGLEFSVGREYGAEQLVGKSFKGFVTHREYLGKRQAQIEKVMPVGSEDTADFSGSFDLNS
jgi:hypothetical protein